MLLAIVGRGVLGRVLQLNTAALHSSLTLMFIYPHTLHIPSLPIYGNLSDARASIHSPLHVSMHFYYFNS